MLGPSGIEAALGNGFRPNKYKISIVAPTKVKKAAGFMFGKTLDLLINATVLPSMKLEVITTSVDGRQVQIPYCISTTNSWTATFYVDDPFSSKRYFEYWMLLLDSYNSSEEEKKPKPYGDAAIGGVGSLIDGAVGKGLDMLAEAFGGKSAGPGASAGSYSDFMFPEDPAGSSSSSKGPSKNTLGKMVGAAASTLGLSLGEGKEGYTGDIIITPVTYTGTSICTYTLYNAYPTAVSEVQLKDNAINELGTFTVDFHFSHMNYFQKGGLLEGVMAAGDIIKKMI